MCRTIVHLNCSEYSVVPFFAIIQAQPETLFPNIVSLNFANCYTLTTEMLTWIISRFCNPRVPKKKLILAVRCPNISKLILTGCSQIQFSKVYEELQSQYLKATSLKQKYFDDGHLDFSGCLSASEFFHESLSNSSVYQKYNFPFLSKFSFHRFAWAAAFSAHVQEKEASCFLLYQYYLS